MLVPAERVERMPPSSSNKTHRRCRNVSRRNYPWRKSYSYREPIPPNSATGNGSLREPGPFFRDGHFPSCRGFLRADDKGQEHDVYFYLSAQCRDCCTKFFAAATANQRNITERRRFSASTVLSRPCAVRQNSAGEARVLAWKRSRGRSCSEFDRIVAPKAAASRALVLNKECVRFQPPLWCLRGWERGTRHCCRTAVSFPSLVVFAIWMR